MNLILSWKKNKAPAFSPEEAISAVQDYLKTKNADILAKGCTSQMEVVVTEDNVCVFKAGERLLIADFTLEPGKAHFRPILDPKEYAGSLKTVKTIKGALHMLNLAVEKHGLSSKEKVQYFYGEHIKGLEAS